MTYLIIHNYMYNLLFSGCPVYLAKKEVYDKFDPLSQKEKDIILSTMFYAVNWFIEVCLLYMHCVY